MSKSMHAGSGPSISVIIPSYNSEKTISYTLDSLVRQNNESVIEIIVVDSSDNDNMIGVMEKYGSEKIIFVNAGTRVKPAIGRNIGAKKAKGQLLIFLDSDVILYEHYIDSIVDAYNKGMLAGIGAIELPDFQRKNRIATAQYYLQLSEYIPAGAIRKKSMLAGCNLFCDRDIFFKVGGFPDMRAAEDIQFALGVNKFTSTWFIPRAVVAHIFREDIKGYITNQKLLGTFVGVYRSKESESFIYRGLMPVILLPAFFLYKYLLVFARVLRAGPAHLARFLRVFFYVIRGVWHWTVGMVEGARDRDAYA
ncbi:MAG: glycosyltransferase [Smithella sp.]|nr:glycosyltransferase [Smithella sp.]